MADYCQDEKFTATCAADEVVLMESARFGRMRLGRCASKDLGWMGCAVDVLRLTDSRCSGQQSCEISVMDPALRELDPCPHDVTWYLEAAYRCVKGRYYRSADWERARPEVTPKTPPFSI